MAGAALLTVDLVWSFWLLVTMEMGEFASFRRPLLIILPIGFILVLRFVDEFLAVRALGILCLLAAEPLLDAAFLRPETSRLLVTVLAYLMIVAGLVLGNDALSCCAIKFIGAQGRRTLVAAFRFRASSSVRRSWFARSWHIEWVAALLRHSALATIAKWAFRGNVRIVSRILVIRGGAIGDFILTLPAIKLLRDSFPAAHLEILGYKHIVALAEMSGYADATRSIEYGRSPASSAARASLLLSWSIISAAFNRSSVTFSIRTKFSSTNLERAGVRNLIVGPAENHRTRNTPRGNWRVPSSSLALYLGRSGGGSSCLTSRETSIRSLIAIHPGSGSEAKNWPLERLVVAGGVASFDRIRRQPDCSLIGGEADVERVDATRASSCLTKE